MYKPIRGWFHVLFKCPTFWHSWWMGRGWYTCPVCGKGSPCYWDANDCGECGSLGVCDDCIDICCDVDKKVKEILGKAEVKDAAN